MDDFDNEAPEQEDSLQRKRKRKNAPAEMSSKRPVSRLRLDSNLQNKKFADPRFLPYTGQLDERKFNTNFSFLDEYREKEVDVLSKAVRKENNLNKKEQLNKELIKMKQEMKERRRALRAIERLDTIKTEEREKVKKGKKPFFLKQSVKQDIVLEEKYKDLKKDGKLTKFMERKRRKNASKDRRWMPTARTDN